MFPDAHFVIDRCAAALFTRFAFFFHIWVSTHFLISACCQSLPPPLLGHLPLAPPADSTLQSIISGAVPSVGDRLAPSEAASMRLFPGLKFSSGELVAVPRSFGGFTIGRVMGKEIVAMCFLFGVAQKPVFLS